MVQRNARDDTKEIQKGKAGDWIQEHVQDREAVFMSKQGDEVIGFLKCSPILYSRYQGLNEEWKRRFLDFCHGKKSLPLTYDPFFKRIFHPDIHPDRLSRFISCMLGITVRVLKMLPTEDSVLSGGTLLIMDLLGELEDGSLVNVEIQKQGYAFPAERISCYGADLLMRQYARVKGVRGRDFTYRDIKKVYVIVIFEKSTKEFHDISTAYLHRGKMVFDTGLHMEFLQEYTLVALDVFKNFRYSKERSEQTAWLSLLTVEDLEEAQKVMEEYPWLEEIYEETAMLRQKPEEVLEMFSEALRILDENTLKYMIEELQKEVEEKEEILEAAIEEKEAALVQLVEKEAALKKKDITLEAKENEIAKLKELLKQYEGK